MIDLNGLLQRHGRWMVAHLPGGVTGGNVQTDVLARREGRLILRLTAGSGSRIVKVFDRSDPAMDAALTKEASVLTALAGQGLGPDLIASDTQAGILILTDLGERRLDHDDMLATAPNHAAEMGRWLARFSQAMPGTDSDRSWAAHLRAYPEPRIATLLDQRGAGLTALPVRHLRIARNDAHLGNWMLTADGLRGIDFEAAELKPLGWDVLLSARVFYRQFPGKAQAAVAALVAGWAELSDAPSPSRFEPLAQDFGRLTAVK